MFANILAAALRNLGRNRLYAPISIASLAIGMAAAVLTGLFIRDELTFDSFIPGHDKVFVAAWTFSNPGVAPQKSIWMISPLASWLRLDFPEIADAERIAPQTLGVGRGEFEAAESVAWADPGFFRLMPYPAVAGDPASALEQPNTVVITRSMARKYFGQDKPLGQVLLFRRQQPFRVTAVIEDFPGSSNIDAQIFASGRSSASPLAEADAQPYELGSFNNFVHTFVRLRDVDQVQAVNEALPPFVNRRVTPPQVMALFEPGSAMSLSFEPIARVHLMPDIAASKALLVGLGAIAALILVVAGANFVNLMTSRASRRAVEVGVRKAVGAEQRHLVAQFMTEALLYAALAMVCALALVELALPALNGLMLRRIPFAYWRDPQLATFSLSLTVLTGLVAGAYPALVLSSFRPSAVLKGGLVRTAGSSAIRQGLVALQFAVLILMLLGVLVIERQTRFAMTKGAGIDTANLLRIAVDPPCKGSFEDAVAKLPGVRSTSCSSGLVNGLGQDAESIILPDGRTAVAEMGPMDFGFMEQLKVKPLAGRMLSIDHPGDALPAPAGKRACLPSAEARVLVDPGMIRAMRLTSPQSAVGKQFRIRTGIQSSSPLHIVGVVPELRFDLTRISARPMIFFIDPACSKNFAVKVARDQLPETMAAITRLWHALGAPRPLRAQFVDDYLQAVTYAAIVRQGVALTVLALIAVLLGGLGMFALAAFTAERRTKEIGVRKAMGASDQDILILMLSSFALPVLWANVIAWPIGWWAMDRWLHGFSARISLSPWFFLAAGGLALVVATSTVCAHALRVARAKPVRALRYE
jgi:putative ABC transport system permease protein